MKIGIAVKELALLHFLHGKMRKIEILQNVSEQG